MLTFATNVSASDARMIEVVPVSVPVTNFDIWTLHPRGTAGENVYDLHAVVYRVGEAASGGVFMSFVVACRGANFVKIMIRLWCVCFLPVTF